MSGVALSLTFHSFVIRPLRPKTQIHKHLCCQQHSHVMHTHTQTHIHAHERGYSCPACPETCRPSPPPHPRKHTHIVLEIVSHCRDNVTLLSRNAGEDQSSFVTSPPNYTQHDGGTLLPDMCTFGVSVSQRPFGPSRGRCYHFDFQVESDRASLRSL